MAVRTNPDGSITVGILKDETPVAQEPKEEKPEAKAEKPRRTARAKNKGEE